MSNPGDYAHERIYYPVVGVITNLRASDDPSNALTVPTSSQRGYGHTCDVYAIAHGNDNPWIIPNVVILPRGPSGVDDYCEDLPRPASIMADGSKFDGNYGAIDLRKCDGDWGVVLFIGGSTMSPILINWFPHPGNTVDPATFGYALQPAQKGQTDAKTLKQGRRSFRRTAGLKRTVTEQGSLYIDTNESNAQFAGSSSTNQFTRTARDDGGDIQVDVKPARQLQVNFNPPVALPDDAPGTPQPNPPVGPQQDRKTDSTAVTLDKDTVELIAGEVVRLLAKSKNIEIHAKTKVTVVGDDSTDAVLLGDTDASNCDHAVNGETFFNNRYDMLVQALLVHTHGSAVGPTDVPINAADFPMHQPADLSTLVKVKRGS